MICRVEMSKANEAASVPSIEYVSVSLSASVAAGMTAPTSVPAALFSATSRVAVAGLNTGALLVPTTAEPLMAMRSESAYKAVFQPPKAPLRRPSAILHPSALPASSPSAVVTPQP